MAEEGLSNSDLELKLVNQSKDLIELQIKFNEEKEKNFNLENKILANELKGMKEVNNLFKKKISDLTIKFEQLNNVTRKVVNFVEIKNKWNISEHFKCCEDKCINTDKPNGNCIKGNGLINLISDEYIRYYNCVEGKGKDIEAAVYTEVLFRRPKNCFNYSLFYFEIKCKMERELNNCLNWMVIGLCNTKWNRFLPKNGIITDEKEEEFKLSTFSWNDYDVFGCGLVYPPTIVNEFPYIFFTQNGKQIGKNKA